MDGIRVTAENVAPIRSWRILENWWPAIAAGSVLLGVGLRLLPDDWFGSSEAFITFFPAIALAALLAGGKAGLAATLLALLVADFAWLEPRWGLKLPRPSDWTALILFAVGGVLVSLIGARLRAGRRREEAALELFEERKHTEELLRRNNETFQSLIESNPMGIYVVDADFRVRNVSRGARRVFESVNPLIGRDLAECLRIVWPEPFATEAIQRFRHTLDSGEPYVARDTVEQRRDIGTVEAYDWRIERVTLPDGRFGVVCYYYDLTEQRRLEMEVRQSEEQFKAMFTVASVGKAQADPATGRLLRANEAFCKMVGQSEAELLARTFLDLTHPDDRERDKEVFFRMARGEIPGYETEKRYLRADGEVIWAHVSANLIRDPKGRPVRTTAVIHDVTDRKRAQVALQHSRDRFELLSRSVGALLVAQDPQPIIEALCNEVRSFLTCDLFINCLLDASTGRLVLNACGGIDPGVARELEDRDLSASLCGSAAGGGCPVVVESLQQKEDSRANPVRELGVRAYACYPLLGPDRQVIGTLSFGARNRDAFSGEDLELMKAVADHVAVALLRKRAELDLRESEERFRTMADGTPVMIWVTDSQGKARFINRAYAEFFGVTHEEIVLHGWQPLVHPDDADSYVGGFLRAVREQRAFRAQARVRRHDGAWRWIESYSEPLITPAGEFLGMAGCSPDVTERKEFERELQRLVSERTARLQELVSELEHFSYTLTHDMRAPLRAMRGVAEIINENDDEWSDEERRKFLRRIIVAAERMDCLINDALNYSKAVRNELPLAPVDTGKLLRGMLETYPEFQGSDAEIQLDRNLPVVMGNEAGLTQCFSNLLGNAVKFARTGERPVIRVRAEVLKEDLSEWVRLSVEDNGVGVSDAMKSRLFDMFARGSHPQAGTGIGLALVRKAVDRMGGRVGVDSEEGRGSRFWLELRLAHPPAEFQPRLTLS